MLKAIKDLSTKATPAAVIRSESDALRARLAGLSPNAAADAWVGLVRDWETLTPLGTNGNNQNDGFDDVMNALPAPEAWPIIRRGLETLHDPRNPSAIALMDDLLGDDAPVIRFLEAKRRAEEQARTENQSPDTDRYVPEELRMAWRSGDLGLLKRLYVEHPHNFWFNNSELSSVVEELGPSQTKDLVRAALEGDNPGMIDYRAAGLREMARQIVLSDLAKMKQPHWELIDGLEDYDFVAAQVARFGEQSADGDERAAIVYGLGLARAGKVDAALKFLSPPSQGYDEWPQWTPDAPDSVAVRRSVFATLSELLSRKFLPRLVPLYVSLGPPPEMERQIESWLGGPGLGIDVRQGLLSLKATLEMAADQTGPAKADLEQGIGLTDSEHPERALEMAGTLFALAVEDKDPQPLQFLRGASKLLGSRGSHFAYTDAYRKMGLAREAQDFALAEMGNTADVNMSAEGHGRLMNAYPGTGAQLAELYYEANEPEQVVALLHRYPKWGAADLADIAAYRGQGTRTIGFLAAWALEGAGSRAMAIRTLRFLIPNDLSDEPACELLNRLEGSSALSFYDDLVRQHPLEQGPLIAKGDLLLRMGKPQEAERTIRAALALDPARAQSGTAPAYDVLARIQEREGKSADAAVSRKVVEAGGLAAAAEQAGRIGLNARAESLYRKALEANPRDADTQLNYAHLLREMGRDEEARAAYTTAAGHVLESEGRAGGANYVWDWSLPILRILESVFSPLEKQHASDPGLLTVLGDVKFYEGDKRAALDAYERAVAADPRYVEGWEGIARLSDDGVLSRAQARDAALALIRLKPDEYYYTDSLVSCFGDYAALWRAYDQAAKDMPALPSGPLYPLEASARALKAGLRPAESTGGYPDSLRSGASPALARLQELQLLFP